MVYFQVFQLFSGSLENHYFNQGVVVSWGYIFPSTKSNMHSLILLISVLLYWVVAFTICLPLTITLVCSKSLRNKFFVWIYVNVAGEHQKLVTAPARKNALQLLKDHLPTQRSGSQPLEVLEIGAGEALNLQYYPDNCNVTFLDPNANFDSYCTENAIKYPRQVVSWKMVRQRAEEMSDVADDSLDVVLSTYVHCSCRDSQAVLREIKRVLKPVSISFIFFDVIGRGRSSSIWQGVVLDWTSVVPKIGCTMLTVLRHQHVK